MLYIVFQGSILFYKIVNLYTMSYKLLHCCATMIIFEQCYTLYNIMNFLYVFCIVFPVGILLSKVIYCCTRLSSYLLFVKDCILPVGVYHCILQIKVLYWYLHLCIVVKGYKFMYIRHQFTIL